MSRFEKLNIIKTFKLGKYQRPAIFGMVLMLLIILNILIHPLSLRFDGSQGKVYTLSSATKKVVNKVTDVVTMTFYVSSDIPTRLQPIKTDVIDLLDEYHKENGKVHVKIVDPKKDSSAESAAKQAGVPQIQFSQLEQDKYAVTASYFGVVVEYGGKQEVLPQVTDISTLEYNLTAAVYKLTNKQLEKVAVVGEDTTNGGALTTLQQVLQQQFTVEPVDISSSSAQTLEGYQAVIVNDMNKQYDATALNKLKNYIDHNGHALFFVNGVWVQDDLSTTSSQSGLVPLLSQYGITVKPSLVLSANSELVNFGNDTVSYYDYYPFWLRTNAFNTKESYFTGVTQLTFPWASSLDHKNTNGWNTTWLVQTTKNSWEQKDKLVLNPPVPSPKQTDLKQFPIAAQSQKQGGKVVVIASSRFVQDKFLSQNSSNLEFVLNIMNDLASGGALSGIRSRGVNTYPLPDIPQDQQDIFKYTVIFLLPALFALYGAWRLLKRR